MALPRGAQACGPAAGWWRFDFRCLYGKSGSVAPFKDFAVDIRKIAERQSLPGHQLQVIRRRDGSEVLAFTALPRRQVSPVVRRLTIALAPPVAYAGKQIAHETVQQRGRQNTGCTGCSLGTLFSIASFSHRML